MILTYTEHREKPSVKKRRMASTTGKQNWLIHAPKPIHPKIFETNGEAISLQHFKLPFEAKVKSSPSLPLPDHNALPSNLNRYGQSLNNADHRILSTVEKQSRYTSARGVISQRKGKRVFNTFSASAYKNVLSRWEELDRSRMIVIREQDEQAAEARPRLVLPQRSGIKAVDRGGQVYHPPHLRWNKSTGPNRMPSSPPRHVASKDWRRSISP